MYVFGQNDVRFFVDPTRHRKPHISSPGVNSLLNDYDMWRSISHRTHMCVFIALIQSKMSALAGAAESSPSEPPVGGVLKRSKSSNHQMVPVEPFATAPKVRR